MTTVPRLDALAATARDREPAAVEVDRAGLEVLDRVACLRLLAVADRGRIALNVGALPVILPVRFALAIDRVLLSVSVGSALDRATDGTVVAFQADGTDTEPAREWSVSVVGTACHLDDPDSEVVTAIRSLPQWAPDLPSRLVAISTDRLTGRRTPGPASQPPPQATQPPPPDRSRGLL